MSEEILMRPSRKFLGGLTNFNSKEQRNFQKAHLRAYLRGRLMFKWGWVTQESGDVIRGHHLVQQDLSPVPRENPTGRAARRSILKGK